MDTRVLRSLLLILVGTLPLHDACAFDKLPALEVGMSSGGVIRLWGPSSNKVEYETSRRNKWNYGDSFVLFKDGTVSKWEVSNSPAPIPQLEKASQTQRPKRAVFVSKDAEAVLSEILKEVPSSPDGSEMAAPGSSSPQMAPNIRTLDAINPVPIE